MGHFQAKMFIRVVISGSCSELPGQSQVDHFNLGGGAESQGLRWKSSARACRAVWDPREPLDGLMVLGLPPPMWDPKSGLEPQPPAAPVAQPET